jgi:hypothetical protein
MAKPIVDIMLVVTNLAALAPSKRENSRAPIQASQKRVKRRKSAWRSRIPTTR